MVSTEFCMILKTLRACQHWTRHHHHWLFLGLLIYWEIWLTFGVSYTSHSTGVSRQAGDEARIKAGCSLWSPLASTYVQPCMPGQLSLTLWTTNKSTTWCYSNTSIKLVVEVCISHIYCADKVKFMDWETKGGNINTPLSWKAQGWKWKVCRALPLVVLAQYYTAWKSQGVKMLSSEWWKLSLVYLCQLETSHWWMHQPIISHTVRCRYNAVNFLTNIHKRHPIARPLGRGMGCLLWIQHLLDILLQFL